MMAEMEQMTAEASKVRTKEKQQAMIAIKEYQDAQSLIGSAITVLKEFYSRDDLKSDEYKKQKSLAQTDGFDWSLGKTVAAPAPDTWDDKGDLKAKEDAASGIIGLLEIAQSDFAKSE